MDPLIEMFDIVSKALRMHLEEEVTNPKRSVLWSSLGMKILELLFLLFLSFVDSEGFDDIVVVFFVAPRLTVDAPLEK